MSSSIITRTFRHTKRTPQDSQKKKDEKKVSTPIPVDLQREEELAQLKAFDLTLEYGPCIGITRLQRWERANRHSLNPPQEVKDLILQHPGDQDYEECLWKNTALG